MVSSFIVSVFSEDVDGHGYIRDVCDYVVILENRLLSELMQRNEDVSCDLKTWTCVLGVVELDPVF